MTSKQEYKYIGECKGNNDNGCFMESPGYDCGCYKKVYQEEPKQETTGKEFYESADAVITISKQLTELEVAIKLEEIDREEYQSVKDFSRGAKWQAKRMYSDIEQKWLEYRTTTNNEDAWSFKEWLVEQYKKK